MRKFPSFPLAPWRRGVVEIGWTNRGGYLSFLPIAMKHHHRHFLLALVAAVIVLHRPATVRADDYEPKPTNSYFAKFNPLQAPAPGPLLLKTGDRLAIIGDSITEQRMYSRIIETYLTVCVPELKITARQFGWSGETAEGFLRRMTNDCLRFQPTVATLCYGMNDHHYRPFDVKNYEWYLDKYGAVVRNLEAAGARVVLGSPGCVGKVPGWTKSDAYTRDELNVNLCALRDGDLQMVEHDDAVAGDANDVSPTFSGRCSRPATKARRATARPTRLI